MQVKMVYKKPSTGGFITIESSLIKEDTHYVYLDCGKYLKKNIISVTIVKDILENPAEDLPDDA